MQQGIEMKRLFASIVLAVAASAVSAQHTPQKPDLIEVIEISGEINPGTVSQVVSQVEKINETPKVKGVLLVVDSPGGGASASAVLYRELAKIKVPVVGFCEYMCASGGVYALMSSSVKYIAVRDDTIGGSVGVIMQLTRFNRLLDWAKVDNQTFKSGPLKDAGNPTRPGTEDDQAYLQGIVDSLASKFYGVVKKSRPKLTDQQWVKIKEARIFIGDDIVKVGLADAVMTRDEAIAKVKELSGTKNAFTRDELRKLTKDASEAASLSAPALEPKTWLGHLDYAMELVREIRSGESVKFSYKLPYSF